MKKWDSRRRLCLPSRSESCDQAPLYQQPFPCNRNTWIPGAAADCSKLLISVRPTSRRPFQSALASLAPAPWPS